MNDDEFYELVDDTMQELFFKIPQHGKTIFCAFPGYNFPQSKEREFMNEVLKRINARYSDKYKIYWKDFSNGFYLIDKEWERKEIEERIKKSNDNKKRSLYIEKGYEEI